MSTAINEPLLPSKQLNPDVVRREDQKTVRRVKLCSACCLGMGMIVASSFASFYFSLLNRATDYNSTMLTLANAENAEGGTVTAVTYDDCSTSPLENL